MNMESAVKRIAERLEVADDQRHNLMLQYQTENIVVTRVERDYLAEAKIIFESTLAELVSNAAIEKIVARNTSPTIGSVPDVKPPPPPPSPPRTHY